MAYLATLIAHSDTQFSTEMAAAGSSSTSNLAGLCTRPPTRFVRYFPAKRTPRRRVCLFFRKSCALYSPTPFRPRIRKVDRSLESTTDIAGTNGHCPSENLKTATDII